MTKKEAIEVIKSAIAVNEKALYKALLIVYAYQTSSEQKIGNTTEDNGVGFTGVDGEFLSSLAKQLKQRGFLTPKQLDYARRKMIKYAGQVFYYSLEKGVWEKSGKEYVRHVG